MPQRATSHPAPQEWLTEERWQKLENVFGNAYSILNQGNLINSALSYWICSQVTNEWMDENRESYATVLEPLRKQWTSQNDPKKLNLNEDELANKLLIKHATQEWSKNNWGHLGESLYLVHAPYVGKVTYGELAFTNKCIAIEIYHQLIAGEISFNNALGLEETVKSGSNGIVTATIAEFPSAIAEKFNAIEAPEFLLPYRSLDFYKIMYVEKLDMPVYSENTDSELLAREFRAWVSDMLLYSLKLLKDRE